jgi:solute carrier family 35 (UDP-sugar transporter), member A1/2/3
MSLVLKGKILFALCSCNVLYTVLRTQAVRAENVAAEDIIIFSELFKLLFCVCMIFASTEESSAEGTYMSRLIWLVMNSAKMGFVALTYFVMNLLSFLNFDYIGAGEFAVFAQAKILWTALFSVLLLDMKISAGRWRALILLCVGCILVASPVYNTCDKADEDLKSFTRLQKYTGYAMVMIQTILSGIANIYFEKVVKSKNEIITIWERNFQLSFWSMIFCMFSKFCRMENVEVNLDHWGMFSVASMILGVTNGLLIALTLKHCDSVLKTVAQSSSIVFCTIIGNLYQNEIVDSFVSMGVVVTIIAVSNYTFDIAPPPLPPPLTDSTSTEGKKMD